MNCLLSGIVAEDDALAAKSFGLYTAIIVVVSVSDSLLAETSSFVLFPSFIVFWSWIAFRAISWMRPLTMPDSLSLDNVYISQQQFISVNDPVLY